MTHIKFSEYLNTKGKLQTFGSVKQIADFEGNVDTKPTKEKKHKDAGGKGQDGEVKPYKGGIDGKDPNKGKLGDGFAHKGDSKLKYEPDTSVPSKVGDGGKKAPTWPKTKTQEWMDRTKGMSLAEFTKTVRTETLKGLDECACQDSPHNSIRETIAVCKCNKKYVSALVREMKRNGLFGKLVKEMVDHPETFKALAILMERDEMYARKLAKAMNEMVAPPMGGDIGAPPMNKMKKKLSHPDMNMGMDDDDMGDDEDMDGEDMGDDEDMDGDDMGDDEGMDDDMGDDEGMDDDMGDMGNGTMPQPKKKSAHQNLMAAMKDHPALNGRM